MKKIKLLLGLLLFFIFNQVFAIDIPQNIKLEKAGKDFLEITWDKVDSAALYAVSYGTKSASGSEDVYEHELEIISKENKAKISNLNPNTKYYIAVKAYDDNEEESEYSKEVSFKTIGSINNLAIEKIEIKDTRNIILISNLELNPKSGVDLNIVNKNDDFETIGVEKYKIEGKKLNIFLDKELKKSNTYKLTVIALEGIGGETIKEGVDGTIDFNVPENTKTYGEENNEEIENNTENDNIEENVELNSAGLSSNGTTENSNTLNGNENSPGGQILDNSQNSNSKQNIKKLPKTGPETFILFFLTFIISFILLGRRKYKS